MAYPLAKKCFCWIFGDRSCLQKNNEENIWLEQKTSQILQQASVEWSGSEQTHRLIHQPSIYIKGKNYKKKNNVMSQIVDMNIKGRPYKSLFRALSVNPPEQKWWRKSTSHLIAARTLSYLCTVPLWLLQKKYQSHTDVTSATGCDCSSRQRIWIQSRRTKKKHI